MNVDRERVTALRGLRHSEHSDDFPGFDEFLVVVARCKTLEVPRSGNHVATTLVVETVM
jgi:hypothetical protein